MLVSGDDDIPNIWKVIKLMFQTTNQIDVYGGRIANTTRRKVPIDADTCVKVVLILPRPAYTTYTIRQDIWHKMPGLRRVLMSSCFVIILYYSKISAELVA